MIKKKAKSGPQGSNTFPFTGEMNAAEQSSLKINAQHNQDGSSRSHFFSALYFKNVLYNKRRVGKSRWLEF